MTPEEHAAKALPCSECIHPESDGHWCTEATGFCDNCELRPAVTQVIREAVEAERAQAWADAIDPASTVGELLEVFGAVPHEQVEAQRRLAAINNEAARLLTDKYEKVCIERDQLRAQLETARTALAAEIDAHHDSCARCCFAGVGKACPIHEGGRGT